MALRCDCRARAPAILLSCLLASQMELEDGMTSFIKMNSVELFLFMNVKEIPQGHYEEGFYKPHEKDDVTRVL